MDENTPKEIVNSQKGVSNTTLAMLVVVALVIIIIGTWAVLTNVPSPVTPSTVARNPSVAKVSLTILPTSISHVEDVAKAQITIKSG